MVSWPIPTSQTRPRTLLTKGRACLAAAVWPCAAAVLSCERCAREGEPTRGDANAPGTDVAADAGDAVYRPGGDALAISVDDAAAELPVLERGALTVPQGAAELLLAGGLRVRVPAGAMPTGSTLEVAQHEFTAAPRATATSIYRFTASAQPSAEVSIVFPIPEIAGSTSPLSEDQVYALWFHERERDADAGVIDLAAGTLSVATRRFSTALVNREAAAPEQTPGRIMLKLPTTRRAIPRIVGPPR